MSYCPEGTIRQVAYNSTVTTSVDILTAMVNDLVRYAEIDSRDGTSIIFPGTGSGPGIVVVSGTLRAGRHYAGLAAALAEDFAVCTVGRRGRGGSGPQGPSYGIDTECAALAAVLARTGATAVFGHCYGALIALETAFRRPEARIERGHAGLREVIEVLAAAMSNTTTVTVLKAGHNGPDIEAPREVAERLRAHLLR
jgi:hypothetical protein